MSQLSQSTQGGVTLSQNVCLISPCDISREGIARILCSEGFTVEASLDDAGQAISNPFDPGTLFLIDEAEAGELPELVTNLVQAHDAATVIILANSFDLHNMLECFRAGARGYVIKSLRAAPMIAAIKLVASGERVLPPDMLNLFENQTRPMPSLPQVASDVEDANLSPREHDVLCCLMAGFSNKVIARELDVCEATVKVHVKAILRKLNVHNRTQAAIWGSSHSNDAGFMPWQSSRYCPTAQAN